MNSALAEVLRLLAGVLGRFSDGWYVFGAQAVAVRGAPRATQDIDVTVLVSREQLPALAQALAEAGLRPRYPEAAARLLAAGAVIPLAHESGMEVDLVIAGSGLEQMAFARASAVNIAGVSVPVAHATDLVVMKVLAGRGKDHDDVRALLASGDVDRTVVIDLLTQLEEALDRSDLLQAFVALERSVP